MTFDPTTVDQPGSRVACHVMLCQDRARGLVELNVLRNHMASRVRVPACAPCADVLERVLHAGLRTGLTPDGALYLYDLPGLLEGRR